MNPEITERFKQLRVWLRVAKGRLQEYEELADGRRYYPSREPNEPIVKMITILHETEDVINSTISALVDVHKLQPGLKTMRVSVPRISLPRDKA